MKQEDILQLLHFFQQVGIEIVVDGGWGVDALLGIQTREHEDLDIAVARKDAANLRQVLEAQGYTHRPHPAESLSGTGSIADVPVKCITAEWVVKFHAAYEPGQKDYHDVRLLCEKFDIPTPEKYKKFQKQ